MISGPIECRTIRYMITHHLSSISLSNVLDICEDNLEEKPFLINYINNPKQYIMDSLMQYSHTWNTYSLNVLFLQLITDLEFSPNNSFITKWKQFIQDGLSIFNRNTPEYFIEHTRRLMFDAPLSDLTATPACSSSSS